MSNEQFWLSVGFVGQAFFSTRFVVQWIASERRKESVIPISFWFFSIGGGLTLFTYALHRVDPVFILGEGAGIFIYSRNLYLIWRKHRLAEVNTKAWSCPGFVDGLWLSDYATTGCRCS